MAEGPDLGAGKTRWDKAFEIVDSWLLTSFEDVTRLSPKDLRSYPNRRAEAGWRVPIEFEAGRYVFDVIVNPGFPFAPARAALVNRPKFLTWPHVESDGVLCLAPANATTSAQDPIAAVTRLQNDAVCLVEASAAGTNQNDFRSEFGSYWSGDPEAPLVRSILTPGGPSRAIAVYRLKGIYFVGDDPASLAGWLDNALPAKAGTQRTIENALLIWRDQALLPSEYPESVAAVTALVRQAGASKILDEIAVTRMDRIVVIIGAASENGPCYAGVVVRPLARGGPSGRGSTGQLERGFRPGHVPADLLSRRFLAAAKSAKASVERFDATWIHGRDVDPDLKGLRGATVTIVGCGALGGPVALALAQAGVGSLNLIDPELLKAANVGRHPLGASDVDRPKAKALVARIRTDYPHVLAARAFDEHWESVAARTPEVLTETDLIVSTIGGWAAEAALNAWRMDRGAIPATLFGWTEPYGVGGHAVALVGSTACLACGLSVWGEPVLSVADWPNGAGLRGEPACGVMFQPYGPIEASHVTALVAEAAIDMLLGRASQPFHRIWAARKDVLDRAGGVWSERWTAACDSSVPGGRVLERPWEGDPTCPICSTSRK